MKNDRLDELTQIAGRLREALPDLALAGDGTLFVVDTGHVMDPGVLIRHMHRARVDAIALHEALVAEPRRKSPAPRGEG